MENLTDFFTRVATDDAGRLRLFKQLVQRLWFVRSFYTDEEGVIAVNDGAGDWFDRDAITSPANPLRAIVIREGGDASESTYSLLEKVMAHCRLVANGINSPDWNGKLRQAYIQDIHANEWEQSATAALTIKTPNYSPPATEQLTPATDQERETRSSPATQSARAATEYATTGRICAAFPSPKTVKLENWKSGAYLSDCPKWLRDARASNGKGGIAALWNPAHVAVAFVSKGHMSKSNAESLIHREFSGWLDEWERGAEHL